MFNSIQPLDIYNKNINILIGSGASADLFPTLGLQIKNSKNEWESIETLATHFENDPEKKTALFMHYYNTCIRPAQKFDPDFVDDDKAVVNLESYEVFLRTILGLLDRRQDANRKVNIFTTNYDGCLAHAANTILGEGSYDFVVNDGASGFFSRFLHAKNFNTYQCQTGVFERTTYSIPQINIINLHGSVYWYKYNEKIKVDYQAEREGILSISMQKKIENFSNYLTTKGGTTVGIPSVDYSNTQMDRFWATYNKLPIVNPTKWKFHETVFEEHYYQMLRLLSYELEKPNSILITFGFSFADEHILKLIQRSLSNPQLQTFICCYSQKGASSLAKDFRLWKNVTIIGPPAGEKLDFEAFNKYIFSLKPQKYVPPEDEELV
ncbi:hypothetical protein PFWH6_3028 [Pseudomonas fluorescens WH6]|nr:hypothetical protein PFWH6_3028 [Pseudomonas fluorescens WH6]